MPLKLDVFGSSDVGRKRANNEDHFLVVDFGTTGVYQTSLGTLGLPDHLAKPGEPRTPRSRRSSGDRQPDISGGDAAESAPPILSGQLLAVSDGMGGHAAGERASQVAIQSVLQSLASRASDRIREALGGVAPRREAQSPPGSPAPKPDGLPGSLSEAPCGGASGNSYHAFHAASKPTPSGFSAAEASSPHDLPALLQAAVARAQGDLEADAARFPEHAGMGATLTVVYVAWPDFFVAHVGDSRCYLLRDGRLQRLTTDHTLGELYRQTSGLPETEGEEGAYSHILWNVLGTDGDQAEPDLLAGRLAPGDRLLICSDGLSRDVPPAKLADLLALPCSAKRICRGLIKAAIDAGGRDNVTAIVARFDERRAGDSLDHETRLEDDTCLYDEAS